jgi:serine/threonine protein kinase
MSPEQMSSPKLTDGRADIWSLGVLLFELLTNRLPFEGETVAVVFAQVLGGTPQRLRAFLPDAPEELERVIDTCLQVDRDRRFQTTDELRTALAPFGSTVRASARFGRSHTPVPVSPRAPWSEPPAPDRFTPVPRIHLTTHSEIVRPRRRTHRALALSLGAAALAGASLYSLSNGFRQSAVPSLRVAQGAAYDAYATTAHGVRRLVTQAQDVLVSRTAAAGNGVEPSTSDTPALAPDCSERERANAANAAKCRSGQSVPARVVFPPAR